MSESKLFEVFYNALSVGWHLRKIKEIAPELLKSEYEFKRFYKWLVRHNLAPEDNVLDYEPKRKKKSS